ncbi:hypothetical protein EO98_16005 [Methanosarcina sp. 2.H.T.1A.6]|uniref:hypothetical protein n=1 Tax=unclassified Methanosarcina TaxID=2644672 RepID=UPI0006226FA7|nr:MULTISPECIES: hypothetical protein [unclassified Methanosarcina]KKG11766.1 hypothetical protein EO97_11505 [Methanosarcina sp. 2.H.T.1A.15]KKG17660.1 hypothetical protein EO94_12430 [Methanosarcina sp. 2.H.T.1A.3]KKG21900.1 hypothetical protein EO98_16005 [Methanosarcina sp. 2.H.T.1A.6]KKG25436.1 hypothetical protein EO96_00455 [Methanosarcina sp. 2.H.T.1A.8]
MSPDENNQLVEEDLSLSEFLVPDTPEIKEIKSIYEREHEYSEYLGEIEFSIADYYYNENRKVTDKDFIRALKNIKQNRDKPISFFEKPLEKEIVKSLFEPLEENPLYDHEFTLVLDYVLWVIDNRSWLEGKQAYVKWITYVLGFLSESEEKKYESQFKKFARKMGVSGAQVDMLLMKKDAEDLFEDGDLFEEGSLFENLSPEDIFGEDRTADDLETGFCLMTDEEKFDFLLDKGPDYIELVQDYIMELEGKENFDKIQDFYKKFNEKHRNFPPLHLIIGTAYVGKDPALAKSYFEEALRSVQESKEFPEEIKEDLKSHIDLLTSLLLEEATEKVEEKAGEGKKGKKTCKSGKKTPKKDSESKTNV